MDQADIDVRGWFFPHQAAFLGAEALYCERQSVSLVRIDEIAADQDGVTAHIHLVPVRGLRNDRQPAWVLYSSWQGFRCSLDHWSAPHVSLTVYFEPGLMAAVVDACQRAEGSQYDYKRFWEISSGSNNIAVRNCSSEWSGGWTCSGTSSASGPSRGRA